MTSSRLCLCAGDVSANKNILLQTNVHIDSDTLSGGDYRLVTLSGGDILY
jgi:hypothetical protein